MPDTVSGVLNDSKALLNDSAGNSYTSAVLLPFLNRAYRELQRKFTRAGQPQTKEVTSSPITVNALATTLTLPADLLVPVELFELDGTAWVPMFEKMWEPNFAMQTRLIYWVWREEEIKFVGATTQRSVRVRYRKALPVLTISPDSDILIKDAKDFLSAKTAGFAAILIGNNPTRAQVLNGMADDNFADLKGISINKSQTLPVRRRVNRYRR